MQVMKENILDEFEVDDTLKAFVVSFSRVVANNPELLSIISKEKKMPEWADLAIELQNKTTSERFLQNINDSANKYNWSVIEDTYRTWGTYGWVTNHLVVPYGFWENHPITQIDADRLVLKSLDKDKLSGLRLEILKKSNNSKICKEAIACFDNRCYTACASLLISLIDGELIRCKASLATKNKKTGLKAGERVVENVATDDMYGLPGLYHLELINYESYINTLFARADGFVKEPNCLNRNYLHHGMSNRRVLRKDCIKLLLAYHKTIYFSKILNTREC